MGTIYIDTGGALTNSGSSDANSATLSGSNATVSGSTVTLDGSPDLSGLSTSGATQSSIYLAQATNTNQKVFWITAVDNGAKTVTVSVAPTGVTGSSWAIGGRILHSATSVGTLEGALRGGDEVVFNNSPASIATSPFTARTSGDNTGGCITLRGKTGVRPVIATSGSGINCITANSQTGWKIKNLELQQTHATTGDAITTQAGWLLEDVKISDAGVVGVNASGATRVINCEITGTGGTAITTSANGLQVIGSYIHDVGADGILHSAAGPFLLIADCIIDTCAGRGIRFSGASTTQAHNAVVIGNTVYGCGDSGLEVADADTVVTLINNIFQDNGNGAGEYNVEWVAGTAERFGYHANNVFYHQGGGGGANLLNLTANSTESTSDPLFTNAAGGDFSVGSSSPAKAAGFPGQVLGGSLGYRDIGAVQRQESGSSSAVARVIGG